MRKLMKQLSGLLVLVLVACMLLPAACAEGEAFTFEIHANGKGYVLSGYNGQDSSVTVPDWYNGLPVVAIGDGAFQGNTAVSKVSLPSTITVIGVAAFKNCTALSDMTSYTAAEQPPVVKPTRVPGDADGDGEVNVMDALEILKYDVGWDVEINLENADVDASGTVDVMDALEILKYDVGWDVKLL